MQQKVRAIAIQLAVLVFFAMAIAGCLCKCSPAVCAARALGGAVVMYWVVQLAGRLVIKILIDAMVDSHMRRQKKENKE